MNAYIHQRVSDKGHVEFKLIATSYKGYKYFDVRRPSAKFDVITWLAAEHVIADEDLLYYALVRLTWRDEPFWDSLRDRHIDDVIQLLDIHRISAELFWS